MESWSYRYLLLWLFDAANGWIWERERNITGTCLQKIYWQKLYSIEYSRNFIFIWWFLFFYCCCCFHRFSDFNKLVSQRSAGASITYCTNIAAVSDTSTTNCTISRSRRLLACLFMIEFYLFTSISVRPNTPYFSLSHTFSHTLFLLQYQKQKRFVIYNVSQMMASRKKMQRIKIWKSIKNTLQSLHN